MCLAQGSNQKPIRLRWADLCRFHKTSTPAGREDDRQQNGHAVAGAIKGDLVVRKPGYQVGTMCGVERELQPAVAEVGGSCDRERIVGPQPLLQRSRDVIAIGAARLPARGSRAHRLARSIEQLANKGSLDGPVLGIRAMTPHPYIEPRLPRSNRSASTMASCAPSNT